MDLAVEFSRYYGSPRGRGWLEVLECLERVKRFDARAILAVLDGTRLAIGEMFGAALEVSIERDQLEAQSRGAPPEPQYVLKQSRE